jgi:hypothetical protein
MNLSGRNVTIKVSAFCSCLRVFVLFTHILTSHFYLDCSILKYNEIFQTQNLKNCIIMCVLTVMCLQR